MQKSSSNEGAKPPSPPRLRATDLPEDIENQQVEQEQFLGGHPILPEDMDMGDLTQVQMYEMNQKNFEDSRNMVSTHPLISPPEGTDVLLDELSQSTHFLPQINTLMNLGYNTIIRAKGDGDCFYRALAFAYMDRLIQLPLREKEARLVATRTILARAAFDENVFAEPYDILREMRPETLWHNFTDTMISNYIVMYMRLLTSAQMRLDEQFANFVFDPESDMMISVDDFCRGHVEPLGKEADNVQVACLAKALNVHVKIAILGGHGSVDGVVNFLDLPEHAPDDNEALVLLYRPGHYDILRMGRGTTQRHA